MRLASPLFTFVFLFSMPCFCFGYELTLTLRPGDLPHPVVVPLGIDRQSVRAVVTHVDLHEDASPPLSRHFTMAGHPIEVIPPIAMSPFRMRAIRMSGRDVMLLSAERYVPEGRVEAVTIRLVVDASGATPWPAPVPLDWAESLPTPEPVMAIVITRTLQSRSRVFARYVEHREAAGMTVFVGTEEDWDVPGAPEPDGRAERIRSWLAGVRDTSGLGYVLLVGDPTPAMEQGIPMKMTHPLSSLIRLYPQDFEDHIDPVPTDHYYSDLEGDWDLDSDGRYLEFPQDVGPGGVRWEPDAIVGRLPVYWDDGDRLDELLETILAYETEPDPSYRHRVLLPAAFIGFEGGVTPTGRIYRETIDGALPAQAIFEAVTELDPLAEIVRLFEEQGVVPSAFPHERPLTDVDVMNAWLDGAGLVVMVGHGSPEAIYRSTWFDDWNDDGVPGEDEVTADPFLSTWRVDELADAPPAFSFHSTCENGWPEFWENLAANLLASGTVASVAASRISIGGGGGSTPEETFEPAPEYGDGDTLAYAFAHLLFEGLSAGEAVAYLRYGLPADAWGYEGGYPAGGYGWLGKLEFNLYGDPTLSLGQCASNEDCQESSACRGSGHCAEGFCVPGELDVDCTELDDQCVIGHCNPISGDCTVVPRPDGVACDDSLYCTVNDRCIDGECNGDARRCDGECSEDESRCLDDIEPEPDPEPEPEPGGDGGPWSVFQDAGCSCNGPGRRTKLVTRLLSL